MRLAFRCVVAAAALLVLSTGISVAGAAPEPGAKTTGKFAYTEEVVYPADDSTCVPNVGCPSAGSDTGNLVVTFDEGSQKRFVSVDYRLDATVVAYWAACGCSPQVVGILYEASNTVTGLMPDDKGRVIGNVALEVSETGMLLQRIEYTNVTLTNLNTGHVYRLDPISQDYP